MLRRWHVLLLILVTLTAFCGLAAAKLRATPKYDRVQVGMTMEEVEAIIGPEPFYELPPGVFVCGRGMKPRPWELDEGEIHVEFTDWFNWDDETGGFVPRQVKDKKIVRRGPLQRLAWLAGWR